MQHAFTAYQINGEDRVCVVQRYSDNDAHAVTGARR